MIWLETIQSIDTLFTGGKCEKERMKYSINPTEHLELKLEKLFLRELILIEKLCCFQIRSASTKNLGA